MRVIVRDLEKTIAGAGEGAPTALHRRMGREGFGEVIQVRKGVLKVGVDHHVLLTADQPQPFPVYSLVLWFYYIYFYSTAGGVRPAAGTSTNQFDVRKGDQFISRMWYLAFDLWLSRRHLDSCLTWRRQQAFFGSFFPITCPLRVPLGQRILSDWTVAQLLCGTLSLSRTGCLVVALDAPWAAPSLTTFLGPKLSDLLTDLLLQSGI